LDETAVFPWFLHFVTSQITFLPAALLHFAAMIDAAEKRRRLAREYLTAVDQVIAAVHRARKLRDALRRKAKGVRNGK
jgi:hypothetical protein